MPQAWVSAACAAMWSRLTDPGPFPRDPCRLARYGMRVLLAPLPGLGVHAVRDYLEARCLPPLPDSGDRRLHGCLYLPPAGGQPNVRAILFYDDRDPEDERRWTVAHELGHLWCDYLEPLERSQRALGVGAVEVLSGARKPTSGEWLESLLQRAPTRPQYHLLERDPVRGVTDPRVWSAENRADRVALELLAPEEDALRQLPVQGNQTWAEWKVAAADTLTWHFGMPQVVAAGYALALAPRVGAGPSFWERMSGS